MKILEIKNVTKYYNPKNPGIINSSMVFEEGKIYGLVGPNGSGKSTVLKILNGLLTIDKGSLHYLQYYNSIDKIRDYFGYVPDTESVWRSLTAKEFIIYINQLFKKNLGKVFYQQMDLLLELFDLTGVKEDLLDSFSFGMKKKIQIIATLLHNPLFFSIDEPMFGLDPESIMILMELLDTYVKKYSIRLKTDQQELTIKPSVLIATHQLEYAEHYCTDFFLLTKNRLRTNGTKKQIYSKLNVKDLNSAFIKSAGREQIVKEKLSKISTIY